MKAKFSMLLMYLVCSIAIGGWSVNEILSWFNKDIPFIVDIILGLIVASVSIPVAIVGWILGSCGVF